MRVELLRDGQGTYGIGVAELIGYKARQAVGFEQDLLEREYSGALILRRDRFNDIEPGGAVLQKICGGFRHTMFKSSTEERLRRFIHHQSLERAGLPWPPEEACRWWSDHPKRQKLNRETYHGLREVSVQVINNLIGRAIEEAADQEVITAARRFAFRHREYIYRACSRSRRALQLTATFPVLALAIFSDHWFFHRVFDPLDRISAGADFEARKRLAATLVERGARLRDIAAAVGMPMALRRIKPGVAHLTSELMCPDLRLLDFMPESSPRSRVWVEAVHWASTAIGPDFASWVARNLTQIPGRRIELLSFLSDLGDWVRACHPRTLGSDGVAKEEDKNGSGFVTRSFKPSMSLKTVTVLSADWHEVVASRMDGPDVTFPRPWYPPATLGAYEIVPLETTAALYREGAALHHCVGSYGPEVKSGHSTFTRSDMRGSGLQRPRWLATATEPQFFKFAEHAMHNQKKESNWQ